MKLNKDSAVRWISSVSGEKKIYILVLMILQAVYGVSGVFFALLMRNIVDAAVGHDGELFRLGLVFILLLTAAQILLRALIRRLIELSKAVFENRFKHRLTETLLSKDYLRVSAVHSGEWMNRLTNDCQVVANGCVEIVPGLVEMLVRLLAALVMIIFLEPRFAAILIPGGLLVAVFSMLFRRVMKRLHKDVQEADGRARIFLQERIGSLLMIHSFAAESRTLRDTDEMLEGHKDARMRRNRFSNLCGIGMSAAMNGMYLLGMGWCGYGILNGTISFGTLTAVTQLIGQIQMPFASITGFLPRYYAMTASAERLMEAEAFPEDMEEAMSLAAACDFYRDDFTAFGFDNVSFTYPASGEKPSSSPEEETPAALENAAFEIFKGEYAAFTGQSGCGKSTALKLLMCIYSPGKGERYYLSADGEKHRLTAAHRRLFAYVPQGNVLMGGSIRDVVAFADPAAAGDDKRLWQALRIACADGFVQELENGPDTILGERGTGLSEGQMQRLAIARAVFSGSSVLLLDEATSALDGDTEKQLLENLRRLTDKTVVIVTHRPAALSICDRVIGLGSANIL